jgi:hypothetical protein
VSKRACFMGAGGFGGKGPGRAWAVGRRRVVPRVQLGVQIKQVRLAVS